MHKKVDFIVLFIVIDVRLYICVYYVLIRNELLCIVTGSLIHLFHLQIHGNSALAGSFTPGLFFYYSHLLRVLSYPLLYSCSIFLFFPGGELFKFSGSKCLASE